MREETWICLFVYLSGRAVLSLLLLSAYAHCLRTSSHTDWSRLVSPGRQRGSSARRGAASPARCRRHPCSNRVSGCTDSSGGGGGMCAAAAAAAPLLTSPCNCTTSTGPGVDRRLGLRYYRLLTFSTIVIPSEYIYFYCHCRPGRHLLDSKCCTDSRWRSPLSRRSRRP